MEFPCGLLKIFSDKLIDILGCFNGTKGSLKYIAMWKLDSDCASGMMWLISHSIQFLASLVLKLGVLFLLAQEFHGSGLSLSDFKPFRC